MTQDDIIRMAREAEIGDSHGYVIQNELAHLERFAVLVIQHKALDQLTAAGQYEQGFKDGAAAEREEYKKHSLGKVGKGQP